MGTALKSLFPDHDFDCLTKRPDEPLDGFTSCVVQAHDEGNVDKLVGEMASALVPGRRGDPYDLAFVIEDLELKNKRQPAVVVEAFRNAVLRHLEKLERENARLAERVRGALLAKASFHLAVPMMEAWLFADPAGPANAGVLEGRLPPNWQSRRDPEDFLTLDPDYLSDTGASCERWLALPPKRQKDHKPLWLRPASRGEHPKAFLAWLSRAPAERECTGYRETHEGASALQRLAWANVLANPAHCTYARALIDDLADALGEPSPAGAGAAAPLTDHRERRVAPVLRNI